MHSLYTGVTKSGKTTLAREHSRAFVSAGQNVIVYDPVGTPTHGGGWNAHVEFDDFTEFMEYMRDPRVVRAHVFIDEAGEHFGVGDKDNHWLLTRGRHHGLFINLIAQRPKMLAPTVRTQCERAYIFMMSPDDMNTVGQDYGHGSLDKVNPPLDRGDFLVLNSGQRSIDRFNVFQPTDRETQ